MYIELYQFLIKHKELPVPGIGTFSLERKPAISDFYNRKIDPPVYSVAFQAAVKSPPKKLFTWIASALNISDREAIIQFNDFTFDIKKKISAGDVVNWDGIGSLNRGLVGEIKFKPFDKQLFFDQPVKAEKIVRDKAEHTIRVGEDEKTSTEMSELLNQPSEKNSNWWAVSLLIAFIAMMFITWYFSEHGLNVSSTANQKKLAPLDAPVTYKVIQ